MTAPDAYLEKELGPKSEFITEQFLHNGTDEIDFQSSTEVYSVLKELESYQGEKRQRLVSHIDDFASDIPGTETDGIYENAGEIADEIAGFVAPRLEKGLPDELLLEQTRIYLGDRLRYFEESEHFK